ncbi:MAG: HAMP domain-containing histidine kinase [Oscillospiraceae bacterium]|nr:HAMP domain-containing histidine kinase [Oscillospiraceae bacterium]
MIRRLRLTFVCINMVTVTAMLCVIFGMVLHFTRENLEAKSIHLLQTLAAEPGQPGPRGPHEVQLPYFTVEFGQWGGMRVVGSGTYAFLDEAELSELLRAALDAGEPVGVLPEYGLRYCRTGPPGGFVFVDISSEISTMENLLRNCLLIGCASFLAFLLISLLLARWAVKPVDTAWRQQRQFVADASHELKTPLTVILTNAELLQDAGPSRFADNILVMARQMRGLVEGLLDLARVDNGEKAFQPVDLSRLVADALLPFEPVFFERRLELSSSVAEDITVQGSPGHLRQVVEILLDNAQKYADAQGTVAVRLERSGGKACLLSVANPGPAISREDLANIFKRFYRVDEARRRDGSCGLGLAIAEGIVASHRGKIWAESGNGVNTFFVRLPVDRDNKSGAPHGGKP